MTVGQIIRKRRKEQRQTPRHGAAVQGVIQQGMFLTLHYSRAGTPA